MVEPSRDRIKELFNQLRVQGDDDNGGISRLGYSEKESEAHGLVSELMENKRFEKKVDDAGNTYFLRPGKNKDLGMILLGSHLDSVPNGGNYDGVTGVVSAMEAILMLEEKNTETGHTVGVGVFRSKESSRFGRPMIGSSLALGKLTVDDLAGYTDKNGTSCRDLVERYQDNRPILGMSTIDAFLEVHIEQGRVLEEGKVPIGLITDIAGPVRYKITLKGRRDHSGNTPMDLRMDAVYAFAEIVNYTESVILGQAFNKGYKTVATIGDLKVTDGSMNTVAGEVIFPLDLRDVNLECRNGIEDRLKNGYSNICKKRRIRMHLKELDRKKPVSLSSTILGLSEEACKEQDIRYKMMHSGAGHDAMVLQRYGIPSGMIFVPSKDGLSHNKEEYTSLSDVVIGTKVLYETMVRVDKNR